MAGRCRATLPLTVSRCGQTRCATSFAGANGTVSLPSARSPCGSGCGTWAFLTQEWPFDDEVAFPLEMLKAGRIQEVIDAAPGFGAAFS